MVTKQTGRNPFDLHVVARNYSTEGNGPAHGERCLNLDHADAGQVCHEEPVRNAGSHLSSPFDYNSQCLRLFPLYVFANCSFLLLAAGDYPLTCLLPLLVYPRMVLFTRVFAI
jgi:hypothetical protein